MRLESKIDHLSCITSSSSKLEYSKRGDRTLSEIFLGWMLCFSQYSFALFSIFTWFLKRHIVIWSFINKPVSSIEGIISLSTKLFAISSPFSIVEDFMSNFLSIVTVKIYQLTALRLDAGRILPINVDTKIILFSYRKCSIEAIYPPCVQTACYRHTLLIFNCFI